MTKRIKAIAAMLMAVIMLFALTACSAAPSQPEASQTAAPADTAAPEAPEQPEEPQPSEEPAEEKPEGLQHLKIVVTEKSDTVFDENNRKALSSSYSALSLTEEDALRYPQLAETLHAYNDEREMNSSNAMEEMRTTWDELKEYRDDSMELSSEETLKVLRADDKMVCALCSYYSYYGGAHGWYGFDGIAFDTETGRKLSLEDLVTDTDAYLGIVDTKLHEDYPDLFEALGEDFDWRGSYPENNYCFSVDYDGMTIYFNPGELGPYAAGVQTVKLYFDEHEGLFNPKYTTAPEKYVIPVAWGNTIAIDADGDGERESFRLESVANDEYSNSWTVKLGDRSLDIQRHCYSETAYILRTNGQYYLYIFGDTDNDCTFLVTVDLKTLSCDEANDTMTWPGSYDYTYGDIGDVYHVEKSHTDFTDPDCFSLTRRFNTLSTVHGSRDYRAGENGLPEPLEDSYLIENYYVIVAKQDIACRDNTIPAGTYLAITATDGESWVELQPVDPAGISEEGNEYYQVFRSAEPVKRDPSRESYIVDYSMSGYPRTVNGIDEEQLFSGMLYAG